MLTFVKSISERTEFAFVIVVAFGYFIYNSFLFVFSSGPYQPLTDKDFYFLLAFELAAMSFLLPLLYLRGWNVQKIGLNLSFKGTLIGVALTIASYAAYAIFLAAAWYFLPNTETSTANNGFTGFKLSLLTIIFEELFVCGYVITSLKKQTTIWFAINASIFIRLLYHLYQGPIGVITIIPIGIIFSYWYARTGKLWPLIVAHGLLDLFGLLAHSEI